MVRNLGVRGRRPGETFLRVFDPGHGIEKSARWRINGYEVRLVIWSPDEWADLQERPIDAQFHPSGVWCALRAK
ncbi:hypothetical protein OJF2_55640 [Aquisphaera giovannonii]|uniref:Uncharacterized protein n=1 Tax=Aquisphaera giovannonii TaxID=406548 RepID=A0A5B9W9Q9_9BACT|nr:hypothetical protein OJF2_55640 [Aquisphaera giovannonii]